MRRPHAVGGGSVGKGGIGLNVPVSGAAAGLRARSDSTSRLSRWVMEYHPSFLQWQNLDSVQSDGRVARRRTPRRNFDSTRVVLDVVGITVALPDAEREQFRRELVAYGWEIRSSTPAGGRGFVATGPDVTVTVVEPVNGRSGIRWLTLSLVRPWPGRPVMEFGGSRLALEDSTLARWTFY